MPETFDYMKMSATHRQLQDIVLGRLSDRGAKVDHRETEAIMLVCAELASIAYSDKRRPNWRAIEGIANGIRQEIEASHG